MTMPRLPRPEGGPLTKAQIGQAITGTFMLEDAIATIPESSRASVIAAALLKACPSQEEASRVAQEIDRIVYMEGRGNA